jgi:hypothetical protein
VTFWVVPFENVPVAMVNTVLPDCVKLGTDAATPPMLGSGPSASRELSEVGDEPQAAAVSTSGAIAIHFDTVLFPFKVVTGRRRSELLRLGCARC